MIKYHLDYLKYTFALSKQRHVSQVLLYDRDQYSPGSTTVMGSAFRWLGLLEMAVQQQALLSVFHADSVRSKWHQL